MIDYTGIAEEELKLRVAEDFFPQYDTAHRIGKIDFAVTLRNPQPATRNPQPATRNPQPATRNPQPATRNPQPGGRCNNVAVSALGRSQARYDNRHL